MEGRTCFCNRALCAVVTGLFVCRQEAGLLGVRRFEPFVDAGRNGLVGLRKGLLSAVVTLKSGLCCLYGLQFLYTTLRLCVCVHRRLRVVECGNAVESFVYIFTY